MNRRRIGRMIYWTSIILVLLAAWMIEGYLYDKDLENDERVVREASHERSVR